MISSTNMTFSLTKRAQLGAWRVPTTSLYGSKSKDRENVGVPPTQKEFFTLDLVLATEDLHNSIHIGLEPLLR